MTELISLLQQATPEERDLLSKIVGYSQTEPSDLAGCLQRVSSSFFGYHLRNERLSYGEIVSRVAEKLGVATRRRSTAAMERAIAERIWLAVWERMTTEQREEFNRKLIESAKNSGQFSNLKGIAIAGGGLAAAKASGFGVYMLASSALGALTSGLGFTLPFGAYMAMSSTLSVILGPVGFLGAGLMVLLKITGPDYQKMTMAIVAICAIRSRLEMERRKQSPQLSRGSAWAVMVAGALAVSFCFWFACRGAVSSSPAASATIYHEPPRSPVEAKPAADQQSVRVGQYLFRVIASTAETGAKLVVEKSGTAVFTDESRQFEIPEWVCGQKQWTNPGDLDGSGNLELLVQDYSGGAHCCTSWRLFRIADTSVSEALRIDKGNMDTCPFTDIDGDGHPEVRIVDESLLYWRSSFANSAMPILVYRLRAGELDFAPDLMRKPNPSEESLRVWAGEISWTDNSEEEPPAELVTRMASLLEIGRASSIDAFVRLAWPDSVPGREQFLHDFWIQVRSSKYWGEWSQLNDTALYSQSEANMRDSK